MPSRYSGLLGDVQIDAMGQARIGTAAVSVPPPPGSPQEGSWVWGKPLSPETFKPFLRKSSFDHS